MSGAASIPACLAAGAADACCANSAPLEGGGCWPNQVSSRTLHPCTFEPGPRRNSLLGCAPRRCLHGMPCMPAHVLHAQLAASRRRPAAPRPAVQHTSASLTINENADPDVRVDMETFFNKARAQPRLCCQMAAGCSTRQGLAAGLLPARSRALTLLAPTGVARPPCRWCQRAGALPGCTQTRVRRPPSRLRARDAEGGGALFAAAPARRAPGHVWRHLCFDHAGHACALHGSDLSSARLPRCRCRRRRHACALQSVHDG